MAVVGIDYGRKRTGFALGLSGIVVPLDPLVDTTWKSISGRIREIQEENGAGTVIIGLPLSASGKPTELSREVESLASFLTKEGFEIELVRETGTTIEAEDGMNTADTNGGRLDSLAAMIILKRYLGLP